MRVRFQPFLISNGLAERLLAEKDRSRTPALFVRPLVLPR